MISRTRQWIRMRRPVSQWSTVTAVASFAIMIGASLANAGTTECGSVDTQSCQLWGGPGVFGGDALAVSSDRSAEWIVSDDFRPVADGAVSSVCWWGIYVDFAGISDAGPIANPLDDFVIQYRIDATDGPVVGGPFRQSDGTLTVSSILTPDEIDDGLPIRVYRFEGAPCAGGARRSDVRLDGDLERHRGGLGGRHDRLVVGDVAIREWAGIRGRLRHVALEL